MSRNIVVGSVEKPTPEKLAGIYETFEGQARKIRHQLKEGERTTSQVQAFVEGRSPFRQEGEPREHPLAFGDAVEILGADKVLSPERQAKVWDFSVSSFSNRHLCPECFLLETAAENQKGEDWRLVFIPPVSYLQARERMGKLFHQNDWWLSDKQKFWAAAVFGPRVELINFHGRYASMSWLAREECIQALGAFYRRAHDLAVTISALSFYQVNDGERLLPNWYHWGIFEAAGRRRVAVGGFDNGWDVSSVLPDYGGSGGQRVCLAREFHSGFLPA